MSELPLASPIARAMPKSATMAWPFGEQDVLGLDVAMDDAAAVGVVQRLGDLAREQQRLGNRKRPSEQPLAERLALDEGHHRVEQARGLARVDQRKDVRVLELGGDADLAEETLAGDGGQDRRDSGP